MINKNYSIEMFIKETQNHITDSIVTRGNVELFRSKLREYSLINNRDPLNKDHINQYIRSYKERVTSNLTWEEAFDFVLSEENKGNITSIKFYFDSKLLIKDLIWRIQESKVKIEKFSLPGEDDESKELYHLAFDIIIENYIEIGKQESRFKDSFGTDGNAIYTHIITGVDYRYLTVGKINKITKEEEIHVFYNEGIILHPKRLELIAYGSPRKDEIFKKLNNIMREKLLRIDPIHR